MRRTFSFRSPIRTARVSPSTARRTWAVSRATVEDRAEAAHPAAGARAHRSRIAASVASVRARVALPSAGKFTLKLKVPFNREESSHDYHPPGEGPGPGDHPRNHDPG